MAQALSDLGRLAAVPVVRGALRGRWWLPAAGGKVWRVLGGSYEPAQTALFAAAVEPGRVVIDVGAHVGYYSLLAAGRAGPEGRVLALEPDPRNARFLRAHARLNGCRNLAVVEAALFDRAGWVDFRRGTGSGTGRVAAGGDLRVRALRLDDVVAEREIVPAVVKIDVEGAEWKVLSGGRETLRAHRPLVFLSVHSEILAARCGRLLQELGYSVRSIRGAAGSELLCVPDAPAVRTVTGAVASRI